MVIVFIDIKRMIMNQNSRRLINDSNVHTIIVEGMLPPHIS